MDRPVARQTAHGSHGKVIARPQRPAQPLEKSNRNGRFAS